MDLNGKADPYLIVKLGKQEVKTKEERLSNDLNPTFGRCVSLRPPGRNRDS